MSDKRMGTVLKKCQKCQVDMNGDMLDAQGLCPRCKAQSGEEPQKNQQGKRDSVAYNANETMDNEAAFSEFITCHRAGRRNAIGDLQGDVTCLSLEKLAGTMDEISIAEGGASPTSTEVCAGRGRRSTTSRQKTKEKLVLLRKNWE